jgi:hypothetical protein
LHAHLGSRTRYYLENPEWRDIGSRLEQSVYDLIVEELTALPGILEDAEKLAKNSDKAKTIKLAPILLQRGHVLCRALGVWWSSLFIGHPRAITLGKSQEAFPWSLRASPFDAGLIQKLAKEQPVSETDEAQLAFEFESLVVAQGITYYWCCSIMLLSAMMTVRLCLTKATLNEAHPALNKFPDDIAKLKKMGCFPGYVGKGGIRDIALALADDVCRAVEYFVADEMGSVGRNSIMGPLWVTRMFLVAQEDEMSQAKALWCLTQSVKMQSVSWKSDVVASAS